MNNKMCVSSGILERAEFMPEIHGQNVFCLPRQMGENM